jgi:hypothetical protein
MVGMYENTDSDSASSQPDEGSELSDNSLMAQPMRKPAPPQRAGKPGARVGAKAAAKPSAAKPANHRRTASESEQAPRPAAEVRRPLVGDDGEDAECEAAEEAAENAYLGDEADEARGVDVVPPPGSPAGPAVAPVRSQTWSPAFSSMFATLGPPPADSSSCWQCGAHQKTRDASAEGIATLGKTFDDGIRHADFAHVAWRLHATFTRMIRAKLVGHYMVRRLRTMLSREELLIMTDWKLVETAENDHKLVVRAGHAFADDERLHELLKEALAHHPDWPPTHIFWHYYQHDVPRARFLILMEVMVTQMCLRVAARSWLEPDPLVGGDPTVAPNWIKPMKELVNVRQALSSNTNGKLVAAYEENLTTNTAQDIQRLVNHTDVGVSTRRVATTTTNPARY